MKRISVLTNTLGIMVLLGLLTAVAVLTMGPWYIFDIIGQSKKLSIGFVQTNMESDFSSNSVYLSVQSAVKDINKSVKTLSPKPPYVVLKSEPSIEKVEDQFKFLYKRENVRIFMVTSETDAILLNEVRIF